MLWFHNWCQDNLDSDRESFFRDIYGSHIFERLTSMKQEGQTKMEPCSKEMETSTMSLKERTNILKLKQMLHKTLNEDGDPYLIEQDKNSRGKWFKMY
ncbi:hypothetical protein ACSQ67_000815 [Phaseolus vulgaris]